MLGWQSLTAFASPTSRWRAAGEQPARMFSNWPRRTLALLGGAASGEADCRRQSGGGYAACSAFASYPPPQPTPSRGEGARFRCLTGVARSLTLLICACTIGIPAVLAKAEELRPFTVVGDAIPASLTGQKGDPARGKAIVLNRNVGLCLLCHSGFPEARFQGDLAPSLQGAGARWSEGQLRLRLVDASRLNPATIMPPYYRIDGLTRVAPAYRGKPILTAEQIEDVVAFLATLKE